ncbi:4'-phosphopantetheinyl transferase superfamily protein [Snodgrassella sp.]|uniref:4'-phosphopantetheinyl transferase family protein n=1 Tax=Snodgrassella sp. TaxID=2815304 RepID=UPI002587E167|nr:4'-phosphopantetheinyl transferase superfamily protein [Snodgrassella sp.]
MIVLAVSVGVEIEIDVKYLDRKNIFFEIAEWFFAENEYQHFKSLPGEHQKQRFFSLWSLKEAYIKACGKGLYIPLDKFWFSFLGDKLQMDWNSPEIRLLIGQSHMV